MNRHPACRSRARSGGVTLIELMVALAVVAVLGVLSYRAVSAATETRERVSAELQRWRDISRFVQMTEADLLQIVARPSAPGVSAADTLVGVPATAGAGVEMSFLKLDGARNSVRRVGYRQDATHLVLLRWPGVDAKSVPAEDTVLENVKALRLAFVTADGQKFPAWPPPAAANTPTGPAAISALPAAIDMELELPDAGTIHRLFALR